LTHLHSLSFNNGLDLSQAYMKYGLFHNLNGPFSQRPH
jgi:hypothetical protein